MTIEEMKSKIATDVKENPVVLFMKGNAQAPQCGFSARVVQILNQHNTPFVTRDVLSDPLLRDSIKQFSDWPTLPQLYVKGEFVGGCDIVTEMAQNGELAKVLA